MPSEDNLIVPKAVDFPMTPLALGGTAAWLIAAGIMWFFSAELAATDRSWWIHCALWGAAMGIPGTITMIVHDRGRKRRRGPIGTPVNATTD